MEGILRHGDAYNVREDWQGEIGTRVYQERRQLIEVRVVGAGTPYNVYMWYLPASILLAMERPMAVRGSDLSGSMDPHITL